MTTSDRHVSEFPAEPPSEADAPGADATGDGLSAGETEALPFRKLAHYEILERIGRGGMGDVFRGYERSLDRTVAIKVLPPHLSRQVEFVQRFYAEASAAARVVHAHVIPIHYIGEDAGQHFFAMQFVEGESLAVRLARRGRLPLEESLTILEQVLRGLEAAHEQGLVHRDIKPGNILLDRATDRALLADFGLVKSLEEAGQLTATGLVLGTADYLSPEQGRGVAVDHRSDLYSLGVVAYQMLSGRLPFTAESPTALIFKHVYERPPLLADLVPDLPPAMGAIVAKLLAKSPDQRHSDCRAVLDDLAAYREGQALPSLAEHVPPEVFARPTAFGMPRPQIRRAPAVVEDAWLPPELPRELVSPGLWFRCRARWDRLWRRNAPWLDQLQSTLQSVDAALAEHEQRCEGLAALVREAEDVLFELRAQSPEPDERHDLDRLIEEQEHHLAEIRLQLARGQASLNTLRSQQAVLKARLRVAEAHQVRHGVRPRRRLPRRWMLLGGAVTVLVLGGLVLRGVWVRPRAPGPLISTTAANPAETTEVIPEGPALVRGELSREPLVAVPSTLGAIVSARVGGGDVLLTTATANGHWEFRQLPATSLIGTLTTAPDPPGNLTVDSGGRFVTVASRSGTGHRLQTWDVQQGDMPMASVAFPERVQVLGAAGEPHAVFAILEQGNSTALVRWQPETQQELPRTALAIGALQGWAVHPAGRHVALTGADETTLLSWEDPAAEAKLQKLEVRGIVRAFHPLEPWLAFEEQQGAIVLHDHVRNVPLGRLQGSGERILGLAFDPTGRRLATAHSDGVVVWDLAIGFARQCIAAPDATSLAFSSDGQKLVTASKAGLQMWETPFSGIVVDLDTWLQRLHTNAGKPEFDEALIRLEEARVIGPQARTDDPRRAVTRDGRLMVQALPDRGMQLVDVRTEAVLHDFRGARSKLGVAISADDRLVAAGSYDSELGEGDVRIYDLRSGRERARFSGHVHYAHCVAFSPDGKRLVSGGSLQFFLWDVETQKLLGRYPANGGILDQMYFSADGRQVAVGGHHQGVLVDLLTGAELLKFSGSVAAMGFVPRDVLCDTAYGTLLPVGKVETSKSRIENGSR